jgi:hypothetical protein
MMQASVLGESRSEWYQVHSEKSETVRQSRL